MDVHFTTWTLRYNRSCWVQIDGLGKHWERARVDAEMLGEKGDGPVLTTQNVTALTLDFAPGHCPYKMTRQPRVEIDEQELDGPKAASDRSWTAHFRRVNGRWERVGSADDGTLAKAARLAGADRRRLHGQLPDGPADRASR